MEEEATPVSLEVLQQSLDSALERRQQKSTTHERQVRTDGRVLYYSSLLAVTHHLVDLEEKPVEDLKSEQFTFFPSGLAKVVDNDVNRSRDAVDRSQDVDRSQGDVDRSQDAIENSQDVDRSQDAVDRSRGDVEKSQDVNRSQGDVDRSQDAVDRSQDVDRSQGDVDRSQDAVENSQDVDRSQDAVDRSRGDVDRSPDVDKTGDLSSPPPPFVPELPRLVATKVVFNCIQLHNNAYKSAFKLLVTNAERGDNLSFSKVVQKEIDDFFLKYGHNPTARPTSTLRNLMLSLRECYDMSPYDAYLPLNVWDHDVFRQAYVVNLPKPHSLEQLTLESENGELYFYPSTCNKRWLLKAFVPYGLDSLPIFWSVKELEWKIHRLVNTQGE